MGHDVTAADEPGSGVSETALLKEEALTDESSYDKLISRGNLTAVPAAVVGHQTDWEGLTPDEEVARKHKDQIEREEYERVLEQARIHSEELMRHLDAQEREVHKKMAEADSRAIVLRDGRRTLVGRNGEYIDEKTGTKLEGSDAVEAQSKRRADSETEQERKALEERLEQINDARLHVRSAQNLAASGSKNPEEMRQTESEVQNHLAIAEAESKGLAYVDTAAETDTAAALGLGGPDTEPRTTSFAATLEAKDSRAAAVRAEFTAQSNPSVPGMRSAPSVPDASAVANRNQTPQPG
jgi:hypothetical protein